MFFSIIIPVYNRPDEINELLESLTKQTFKQFEVLIIEDGSTKICKDICESFGDKLDIRYFYKANTGQGFSRNFGFERAKGEFFIVFDSDVIVPPTYFEIINLAIQSKNIDAFGGPDEASPDFTDLQKAISYSMTSTLTTGGIRGKKQNIGGKFQPRSFNMGISKAVFDATGGFGQRDKGEDIELSIRILEAGFKVELINEAFVYHKRRGNLKDFFKQIYSFGQTRILLSQKHNGLLKAVHFIPALFLCFGIFSLVLLMAGCQLFILLYLIYFLLVFVSATIKEKSIKIGLLSIASTFVQHNGYGLGFFNALFYKYFPSKR